MPPDDPRPDAVAEHAPDTSARARGSSRRTPRWILILAAALLVARIATGVYERANPPAADEKIGWMPIAQGEMAARSTGKPILYDFTAEWCPPCKAMNRELFSDEKSAATLEQFFVPIRVLDRSREEGHNPAEVTALQNRYRVDSFPTLVVAAADGNELARLEGYRGAAGTMNELMRAVASAGAPRR